MLQRIDELLETPDVREFHELLRQVETIDRQLPPVELPSVAAAMAFRRYQMMETVAEIAARAGVTPEQWEQLENGAIELDMAAARKIHTVGIPSDVLLQVSEPKQSKYEHTLP